MAGLSDGFWVELLGTAPSVAGGAGAKQSDKDLDNFTSTNRIRQDGSSGSPFLLSLQLLLVRYPTKNCIKCVPRTYRQLFRVSSTVGSRFNTWFSWVSPHGEARLFLEVALRLKPFRGVVEQQRRRRLRFMSLTTNRRDLDIYYFCVRRREFTRSFENERSHIRTQALLVLLARLPNSSKKLTGVVAFGSAPIGQARASAATTHNFLIEFYRLRRHSTLNSWRATNRPSAPNDQQFPSSSFLIQKRPTAVPVFFILNHSVLIAQFRLLRSVVCPSDIP